MGDEAQVPVRAVLYHDFDQRWRVVLEGADGDEVDTIVLPADTDGIRSAVRHVRSRLRERALDVDSLEPIDADHDTWEGSVTAIVPVG